MLTAKGKETSARLAAPSYVVPAGVVENCRFLAPHFQDIGLYFLEVQPCLDYRAEDLPGKGDAARFHVHLPLDLPWDQGAGTVFALVSRLCDKIVHLSPWGYALHPPAGMAPDASNRNLAEFADLWRRAGRDPADILLENVEGAGARRLFPAAWDCGFSLCLDLGHMLAYAQEDILSLPGVFARTRMLHVYAPFDPSRPEDMALVGRGHRHRALSALDGKGRALLRDLLENAPCDAAVMLEVFSERDMAASREALFAMTGEWGMTL